MDTIVYYVRDLLGAVPAGYEVIEYVVAGVVLVLLCSFAVSMISAIFKWIGGI